MKIPPAGGLLPDRFRTQLAARDRRRRGALLLVTLDGLVAGWQPRALLQEVPWTLFPLLAGLLLLVGGAERIGLFAPFVDMVEQSACLGPTGLPLAALGMAVLANGLNNLPAAVVVPGNLTMRARVPRSRTRHSAFARLLAQS